jgi:acyl-CoA thioesterase FadM
MFVHDRPVLFEDVDAARIVFFPRVLGYCHRFGDVARTSMEVAAIGKSSCTFQVSLTRARDGAKVAQVKLVCVATDLTALRSVPLPADVRAILERHRVAG